MDAFKPSSASRQAYIQRTLRSQQPVEGVIFGAGKVLRAGGGLGTDFVRHAVMVLGVAGLVGMAVGATTECGLYNTVLNWITSLFA